LSLDDGIDYTGLSAAESAIPMSFLNYRRRQHSFRAAVVYSGNPDRDIIKNQSEIPSPPPLAGNYRSRQSLCRPDLLQATTYLIAAERALHHLECNLPQIDKIFSDFQIPQSDYGVCAGFDQEQVRLGFYEQIHVFIRSEVHDMPSLLSELGSVFAPFPAILFTETSSYDIPVSEAADSVARPNELVQATISKYNDNGIDAHTRPIAICLTRASQSDPAKGFGSGTESNRQNSGNNNEWSTDRWEGLNEDKPSNGNKNGVGQGPESEPSGRGKIKPVGRLVLPGTLFLRYAHLNQANLVLCLNVWVPKVKS
jgi:hypothetical protein